MSEKEIMKLRLMGLLLIQEMQIEIIYLPEVLSFEHSLVFPN